MTTTADLTAPLPPDAVSEHDAHPQRVIAVHNCNRLGRTANPPRFSATDWFRFGLRR